MIRVSDWLYRGKRPQSFTDINGIAQVCITLQSGAYEEFTDDSFEREWGEQFGVTQVYIPCSDFLPPKKHEVQKFLFVLTTAIANNRVTYVHCLHGKDRTGFMVAVYRMQMQDWSYEQARNEMFEHGFHKIPYSLWLPELKRWEKHDD